MSVLLYLLVLTIVFGLLFWATGMLPLPAPFGTVVRVILVVIFAILLLSMVTGWWDGPVVVHDRPTAVVR